MELAIYKYPLPTGIKAGRFVVHMPANATILTLQPQHGVPTIWAEVRPDLQPVMRSFVWFFTGDVGPFRSPPSSPYPRYVGTFQWNDGIVSHLYDRGEL